MVQTADTRQRFQCRRPIRLRLDMPASRSVLVQPQMSAVLVIVGNELTAKSADVRFIDRDQVIEAFTACRANPSFRDAVLPRAADARSFRLNARRFESALPN